MAFERLLRLTKKCPGYVVSRLRNAKRLYSNCHSRVVRKPILHHPDPFWHPDTFCHDSASWYIKLLPDPVGRTAKTSVRSTYALIAFLCSSFKINALSMSSKTDSNLQISALQRQPCLLKTNSTQTLWWRGWLRYGWSSVHHRVKPALTIWLVWSSFWSGIISPQWSNARPNFPTSNVVGGAKFGLVSRLMFDINSARTTFYYAVYTTQEKQCP